MIFLSKFRKPVVAFTSLSALTGLVSLGVLMNRSSIKDSLISKGYVLAGESDNWSNIFLDKQLYLNDSGIKNSGDLKNACLKGAEAKSSSRSMSFYENICAFNMKEMIKRENGKMKELFYGDVKIKESVWKDKEKMTRRGIFFSHNDIENKSSIIAWCRTQSNKPYSNANKNIKQDLTDICFGEEEQKS